MEHLKRCLRIVFYLLLSAHFSSTNSAPPVASIPSTVKYLKTSNNPHIRPYAYVLSASVWPSPQIYVCWENPSDENQEDRQIVRKAIADTWEENSKLRFSGWEKCPPLTGVSLSQNAKITGNQGIRIRISDTGPRTLKLGRELSNLANGMVLNFSFKYWMTSCQEASKKRICVRSIAIHEFGHAIGFAHEQDRSDVPGECAKRRTQGQKGDITLTPYDEHSAMNYCANNYDQEQKLSELDIAAVQILYGKPNQPE